MTTPPAAPATIPWHARLEARVLIVVTLVATVLLAAVLLATTKVVAHYSLTRSVEDLTAARAAFERLTETRRQSASKTTRLIVELPTFRDLIADPVAAADAATLDHTTKEYCEKLGAHFCVVTDPRGRWMGRSGAVPAGAETATMTSIGDASAGRSSSATVVMDRGLYLVVAEPAMFGAVEVIGTFTAGFRLDDAVATELAGITNSDVSFLCPTVCGSSLPAGARGELLELLARSRDVLRPTSATPALHTIGRAEYVGARYALDSIPGQEVSLVLLKNWAPTARALREIDLALAWVTVMTLGVAVGGTLVFSRRLTRPLRDLAAAADGIASGETGTRVRSTGPIETRHLADAFNRMADWLVHWQDAVEARTAELNVAYRRFRAITDSASDAIVSIDARGRIVFWNPRAAAVFGYTDAEATGQYIDILVPDEQREDCASALQRLAAGETEWLGHAFETTALCRDGSRVAVELSISRWSSDAEVFHTGIIRDMTERRQAADALKQREDQLRQAQKMEAVGRLAGGVAHDFNNLLTAILGYADLLIEQLGDNHAVRPKLLEIQKAGRTAASLTRDLLAFSRKQVLQPVVLDMNAVIRNDQSLLQRLVGEDVHIDVTLDAGIGFVKADPGQISQVLLNLVVNARDAMPDGGERYGDPERTGRGVAGRGAAHGQ